jgi:hypothetical protein
MRNLNNKFTIIELVTASTLTLIMFMIIGYVFGSVSDATTKMNDKITEGLRANYFFSKLADDVGSSFPVFYLGEGSEGGNYVNISKPGIADPATILPGGYTTAVIHGVTAIYGNNHAEFMRSVSTNHENGGLLNYSGFESPNSNMNVDQNDKPVRYVTYNITGANEVGGGLHARTVYRRDFPLRPDVRKGKAIKGGYSAGASFVKIGTPGDGVAVANDPADGDINQVVLLDGVYEVRTSFIDIPQDKTNAASLNFGDKVAVKVTIEYALTDTSFPYGNPLRYSRYPVGDMDGNFISDRLEHTYTTVIVVNRTNWDK